MMSTAPSQNLLTADELWQRASKLGRCELIKGELVMMNPAGGDHGYIAGEIFGHIWSFLQEHDLGKVYAAETGFVLERDPDTVRAPDVAFIAKDRVADAKTPKFIPVPPDLVVEVNSPGDAAGEVVEKVQWWLSHGAQLVWVVDPTSKTVTAYQPDGAARVLQRDQTLDGGAVLPGFTLPVAAIFDL